MEKITQARLNEMVRSLNDWASLDNNTNVMFKLSQAYGGNKLVLVRKNTGGQIEITYGFVSKKELAQKIYKLNYDVLTNIINKELKK